MLSFFKHDDSALNTAFSCVGSVARQLANQVEGFRGCLESSLAEIKQGDSDYKNLESLIRRAWLDPAKAAVERSSSDSSNQQIYLILLDALDECVEKNQFIPLLGKLLPEFPSKFGFVITTRPDVEVPKLDKFEPVQLRQDDTKNRADVSLFLKFKLGTNANQEVLDLLEKNALSYE